MAITNQRAIEERVYVADMPTILPDLPQTPAAIAKSRRSCQHPRKVRLTGMVLLIGKVFPDLCS
jgi:hypothetical protein